MALGFATATPAVIAGFASLAQLFRFISEPYAIQTPEGFITTRWMGAFLPLILSFWPILAFLEELLEGAIQMPSWAMSLSIFHLYGNPIFLGVNWNNFLGMTGVAVVLLLIGLVQFRSADIKLG